MNNNIFEPSRFINLFKREFQYHSKNWILFTALFAGLPVIMFMLNIYSYGGFYSNLSTRFSFWKMLIGITTLFAPFIFFYNTNHPKKGLTEVLLPASTLEKFLMMQLSCFMIAPFIFTMLYAVMDSLLHLISPFAFRGMVFQEIINMNIDFEEGMITFLIMQIFFFFNMLFVRRKVLKSFGTLVGIQILFGFITFSMIYILKVLGVFQETYYKGELSYDLQLFDFDSSYPPYITIIQIVRIFFVVVLPILLFVSSYYLMRNRKY